jgi:hypothetical protein
MSNYKLITEPSEICRDPRAKVLLPLFEEAYSYGYDERPLYNKLMFLLEEALINTNCIPDRFFSWFQPNMFDGRPLSGIKYAHLSSQNVDEDTLEENVEEISVKKINVLPVMNKMLHDKGYRLKPFDN